MQYLKEHIELTENIIKNSPGYRGNEDLLEEIVSETLKRAQSFLESSDQISTLEIYLKKIALNVIVESVKNAEAIRAAKSAKLQSSNEFKEIPICYKTDENGKIIYEADIPAPEYQILSDEQINKIKEKVLELDNFDSIKKYRQIFELRFINEMPHHKIAEKLEMEETEVVKTLLEIFKEVDYA